MNALYFCRDIRNNIPFVGANENAGFIPHDFFWMEQGGSRHGVGTESEWGYARIING